MTAPNLRLVLRPVPGPVDRDNMDRGVDRKGINRSGPSREWWARGALVVDDDGPAVVDADGLRVPMPIPPGGGQIVWYTSGGGSSSYGPAGFSWNVYVCDADRRKVAQLPDRGFDESDFERLAALLGVPFERRVSDYKTDPGLIPGFVYLVDCTQTAEDRAFTYRPGPLERLRHKQRKVAPTSYPEGVTYPPMDPAYLSWSAPPG